VNFASLIQSKSGMHSFDAAIPATNHFRIDFYIKTERTHGRHCVRPQIKNSHKSGRQKLTIKLYIYDIL
jgi:hypothetical protein